MMISVRFVCDFREVLVVNGLLMRGPLCCVVNLRNDHVIIMSFIKLVMSHVACNKLSCSMSNQRNANKNATFKNATFCCHMSLHVIPFADRATKI